MELVKRKTANPSSVPAHAPAGVVRGYDVRSGSDKTSLEGTPYAEW